MEKEEILQKASNKHPVGEMEKKKINTSSWIALLVAGVLAVALMIVEGVLGHFTSIYALASVCYVWASVFYFLQYFIAKRPRAVLIGAILEGLAGIGMLVLFILTNAKVI